jgi:hypothetical protein
MMRVTSCHGAAETSLSYKKYQEKVLNYTATQNKHTTNSLHHRVASVHYVRARTHAPHVAHATPLPPSPFQLPSPPARHPLTPPWLPRLQIRVAEEGDEEVPAVAAPVDPSGWLAWMLMPPEDDGRPKKKKKRTSTSLASQVSGDPRRVEKEG